MTTTNNHDEVAFDPTAVEGIDQATVEQTGPSYPTIQWHYGDPKLKKAGGMDYQGGFFIPADTLDDAVLLAAGWEQVAYTHPDGSNTPGFWRRELAIAVLALRKRWEVRQEGARTPQLFAWSAFDQAEQAGRPSSRTHVLCLIKGLTDYGPFVLTLKGMAGMSFEGVGNQPGVLVEFSQTIIRRANQESDHAASQAGKPTGKRWPFRCFWLPVGAARDAKGEPVFSVAGKGNNSKHVVLPQALGLPAKVEDVNLARFYVGPELLTLGNTLYAEAEANWTHAWDTFAASTNSTNSANGSTNGNGASDTDPAGATVPTTGLLESLGL